MLTRHILIMAVILGGLSTTSCTRADPGPAASTGKIMRFKTFSIRDRDDMIGGEAVSMLMPSDWQGKGEVVWRMHPTMPAGMMLRLYNPAGLEAFEAYPPQPHSWGGMLSMTGFPEGSYYLGNEVRPPPSGAFEYIERTFIPRVRAGIHVRVIGRTDLPEMAQAIRAQNAAQAGQFHSEVSAGKVRIEYSVDGQLVEEDFYATINTIFLPGGNMAIWIADQLGALRAPKGQLDEQATILQTLIASTRINPRWFNKYQQLVEALTAYQNRQIANAGVISRIISRTSDEISDMRRQSYEQTQATMDRISESYSQYQRGVDEYRHADTGTRIELPSGYSHAWRGLNDEYIVTDNPNFNPNVELNGDWTPLERTGP